MEISLVPHRTKVLELGKVIKGPYKMIGGGGANTDRVAFRKGCGRGMCPLQRGARSSILQGEWEAKKRSIDRKPLAVTAVGDFCR